MDYESLKLWEHQKKAIRDTEKYLRDESQQLGYLVKMPTGSGKTAIMAVLARIIFSDKNFLIVVPSIALRKQLIDQLTKDFWEDERKMNILSSDLPPKEIKKLLPSTVGTIRDEFDSHKNYIFVCVVNTLFALKEGEQDLEEEVGEKSENKAREKPKKDAENGHYLFIKDNVDFVFFDEGHKEPAYSWAKAVRELEKKTVLFSATPFRNDLKLFHIDKRKGHFHFLTHQDAVDKNIIRNVSFHEISSRATELNKFIKHLIVELIGQMKLLERAGDADKGIAPISPKVIIRCSNEERVQQVAEILQRLKKKVLGLHENFGKDKSSYLQCNVPGEDELNKYEFVVHQNKLIEGIDNPNFLILVILDAFDNERAIFQQIGRITRNLDQIKMSDSLVYYPTGTFHLPLARIWEKFLAFDKELSEGDLMDASDLVRFYPTLSKIYIKNAIRTLEEVTKIEADDINIPKRTSIREWSSSKQLKADKLYQRIIDDLEKKDANIDHDIEIIGNGHFIVYHGVFMSPYFDTVVLDLKYEVVIFFVSEKYIFYLDTSGKLSDYILEMTRPLDSERLLHMTSGARRLNNISLVNTDLNKSAIRRRQVSALKLHDIAPLLNDHNYVASSVSSITRGFTDPDYLHRYIGIKSGKVSEYTEKYCDITEYTKWIDAIRLFMRKTLSVDHYFNRYSRKIPAPKDLTPVSILIDLESDDQVEFRHIHGKYEWVDVADNVKTDGEFKIKVRLEKPRKEIDDADKRKNGCIDYTAKVEYNPEKEKYELECEELAADMSYTENGDSIITYLNKNQSFRIVTKNNRAFYVFGAFYSPRLQLGKKKTDLDLLRLLIPIKDLKTIKSEKGNMTDLPPSRDLWHENTLFGMIARMGVGYQDEKVLKRYLSFTHLVCDDLGNEIGDFIGLDTDKKRIVIIHAKSHEARLSASSFQDVCGQATKKLDFLSPFYVKKPDINIARLDDKWFNPKVGTVKKRILAGGLNGAGFWNQYEELVSDPDTRKEVYLFTGSMLDKDLFKSQLESKQITQVRPETIDLAYLLRSTWSAVSHMGASLKVFCY